MIEKQEQILSQSVHIHLTFKSPLFLSFSNTNMLTPENYGKRVESSEQPSSVILIILGIKTFCNLYHPFIPHLSWSILRHNSCCETNQKQQSVLVQENL